MLDRDAQLSTLDSRLLTLTLQQTPRVAVATSCPAAYRARSPRATPLYRLFEKHFDEVRGRWEERFERRYGFWRGFVDDQVLRYLDCGLFENGFARIRCPECAEEFLLALLARSARGDSRATSGWP